MPGQGASLRSDWVDTDALRQGQGADQAIKTAADSFFFGGVMAKKGLRFPANLAPGSDIRIVFSGAARPSRTLKTVLWDAYFFHQTGYYAWVWDNWGDDAWHDGSYECGMHPFPCNGAFDGNGIATGGTGGTGEEHSHEVAGAGDAVDAIASPGGQSYPLKTKVWLKQAGTWELITVTTTNDTIEHVYYVDLSDVNKKIVRRTPVSSLASPPSAHFSFGASPWRKNVPSAGQNDETPNGMFCNQQIYSAKLSVQEILKESHKAGNVPVTPNGVASIFYSNVDPESASDISDKSGRGNNPSYANANRPTFYGEKLKKTYIKLTETATNWDVTQISNSPVTGDAIEVEASDETLANLQTALTITIPHNYCRHLLANARTAGVPLLVCQRFFDQIMRNV